MIEISCRFISFPAKVGVCNGSFLVAKLLDSIHVEDKMK